MHIRDCKNVIIYCTDKNAVWIAVGRDKASNGLNLLLGPRAHTHIFAHSHAAI